MEPHDSKTEMLVLAEALNALRDSWVLISMALKDHLAEAPSSVRDEVMVQVERHLARFKEGNHGSFK